MNTASISLAPDMSNKAAFVNGLFTAKVRDSDQNRLLAQIQAGALTYAYADADSCGLILGAWLAAWQAYTGGSYDADANARCPSQDRALLELLADYVSNNALALCRPALTLSSLEPDTNLPIYANAGYDRLAFMSDGAWVYGSFDASGSVDSSGDSSVAWFLHDLFYGAHIVVICSSADDAGQVSSLRATLEAQLPTRTDPYNSHYSSAVGLLSGDYYTPDGAPIPSLMDVDVELLATSDPPGSEPLAIAVLVGKTAMTKPNEFLQLEGWPAQDVVSPAGGDRHSADYASNEATYWNFSTFGACAYSEKRSTPMFLAPAGFDLTIHADTGMPYYWGANAGNVGDSWMHPQLVVNQ